jgi:hypothetical protein
MSIGYDNTYFEINYEKRGNVIRRTLISEIEKPDDKHKCLVACIKHFTGIDVDNITDLLSNFRCYEGKLELDERRCCCSQYEINLNCYTITHIETGLTFVIGGVCFTRLFSGIKKEEWLDMRFFQPDCKFCSKKVKRNKELTKGFCGLKCLKDYNEREEQIRKKKEWDDGAPEREAKRIARLAELEEEEKKRQEIKKKFPYGIWLNCQRCDRENKTDFQKKYKICENCCKK